MQFVRHNCTTQACAWKKKEIKKNQQKLSLLGKIASYLFSPTLINVALLMCPKCSLIRSFDFILFTVLKYLITKNRHISRRVWNYNVQQQNKNTKWKNRLNELWWFRRVVWDLREKRIKIKMMATVVVLSCLKCSVCLAYIFS